MRPRACFLGPPALEGGQGQVSLSPGKGVALAAFLAAEGVPVGRERLVYLFWPDRPEAEARTNLRQLLRGLKGKPLGGLLELDGPTLRFTGSCDLVELEQARARRDWEGVLGLWRGEFLAGLEADTDTLDDWLQAQRERWKRIWREAMLARAAQLEQSGQLQGALGQIETLIEADWLSEELYAKAIRLAQQLGDRARALEWFARLKQRLQDELGLEPLPQTAVLVQAWGYGQAEPSTTTAAAAEVPLVGRGAALARLVQLAGAPGLVLLSGEGGVGKSRLCVEALAGALVLRAEEGLMQSPFHPLVRALSQSLEALQPLPEFTRQELKRLIPQLPGPTPNPDPDPEVARARLWAALLEALRLLAGSRLVVLEDLHWADEATLGFVGEWATRWAALGGRLVITVRTEEAGVRPALGAALRLLRGLPVLRGEVALKPLEAPDTQALVGAFLGLREGPQIFAQRVYRASGGNPLFTLEVLRQLVAEGTLRQDETGQWYTPYDETTQDYAELGLPESVRASLQRRLSFLSEAERRIADATAVYGVGLPLVRLEQVTGLSGWALIEPLEHLVQMGLLLESEQTYRMSHDLLRQHTYGAIPPLRRRLLHRGFAEALESSDAVAAAHHWQAAGERGRAAQSWLAAGVQFHERGLLRDAEGLYGLVAEQAPDPQERLWARVLLAILARTTQRFEAAVQLLEEVLASSARPLTRTVALVVRAELHFNMGEPQAALTLAQEAERLFEEHPDPTGYVYLTGIQIKVAGYLGQHERAIELLRGELERTRGQPFHPNQTMLRTQLAHHLDALERYEEALPIYRSVLQQTQATGDHPGLVYAAGQHLFCCTRLGRAEEGLALAEQALALGEYESSSGLRYHLARAYFSLKRYNEAALHAEALIERYGLPYIRCVSWAVLAEAYAGLGLQVKSLEAIHQALHYAQAGVGPSFAVRAVTATLRVGSGEQQRTARALLKGLSLETVPAYHRADLAEALRLRAQGNEAWPG